MHKLAARAKRLSRQLYVSLPLHYRVAQMMLKLSVGPQETHGRFFYGIFIKAGIKGMPDINGMPVEEWEHRKKSIHELVSKLPKGYGRNPKTNKSFGAEIWKMAVSRYGHDVAEDAISWMVEKLTRKPSYIKAGYRLSQAESWVMDGVRKRSLDMIGLHYRDKERSITRIDDSGQSVQRETADPGSLEEILGMIPEKEVRAMKSRLRKVDRKNPKRAEQYLRSILNDESQKDLSLLWILSQGRVSGWIRDHREKIRNILKEYIQGVAA